MDLLNIEKLDENLMQNFSNARGRDKRRAKRTIGKCLQPAVPENLFNRKKWNKYRDCLKTQLAEEQAQRNRELDEQKKASEAVAFQRDAAVKALQEKNKQLEDLKKSAEETARLKSENKILGMPKGVAIGVGALGVAILGFIAYKIIKR